MTEKFFNILNYDVIPVVLNGADMEAIAPAHSYINVQVCVIPFIHFVKTKQMLLQSGFWNYQRFSRLPLASAWEWFSVCLLLLVERFLLSEGKFSSIENFINILSFWSGASTLLFGPLLHGGCRPSAGSLVLSMWEAAPKYYIKINCQLGKYLKQGEKL